MATIMSRGRFSVVTVSLCLVLAWSIHAFSQPDRPAGPTFVGAQACAACHQQIHAEWKGARHSKMIQPATPGSVLGDFSKDLTLKGNRYRLRVANGQYFVSESYLTGKEQEHRVELTLGSRRIQRVQIRTEQLHVAFGPAPRHWQKLSDKWLLA